MLAARSRDDEAARRAFASLYEDYWYPLYAYLRRRGHDRDETEDLLQAYFLRLLERSYLDDVMPEAGRFRAFLLVSLRHFASDARKFARAYKRSGASPTLSLDSELAERRYVAEPADTVTAEKLFEYRWAMTVLERVLGRLRDSYERSGKEDLFAQLETVITGSEPNLRYSEIASRLEMTEGAVKVAAHRLRRRFGRLLRTEIAHTVADSREVEGEIRYLLEVLADRGIGTTWR